MLCSIPLLASAALAATPVFSQLPAQVLVRQGDPVPGVPGETVQTLGLITTNGVGGFACMLDSSAGRQHIVGMPNITWAPGLLRSEKTGILAYDQYFALSSAAAPLRIGIDDQGNVSYGCKIAPAGSVQTPKESIWLGDALVAPPSTGSTPVAGGAMTRDGRPLWVANNRLYAGSSTQVILDPTNVPGLLPGFDRIARMWEVSPSGSHSLVGLSHASNYYFPRYFAVDGQLAKAGGQVIEAGGTVPLACGGLPGETWYQFDEMAIGDSGSWALSCMTLDPAGTLRTVVVVDGVIRYRSGDALGGGVLATPQKGLRPTITLDEQGALAMVAWIDFGYPSAVMTLFYDGVAVTRLGDSVDLDGDGVAEPFTGIASMHLNGDGPTVGGDRRVYLHAIVDDDGTVYSADDESCAIRAPIPPIPYGQGKTSSLGLEPKIGYSGTPRLATNDLVVHVDDLIPNKPGQLFYGTARNAAPFVGGTLLVSLPLVRLPAVHADAQGSVSIPIAIDAAMPGTVRRYQFWQRDPLHPDGTQACLSNALEVSFFP